MQEDAKAQRWEKLRLNIATPDVQAATEQFDASLPGSVVAVPPIWTNEDGQRLPTKHGRGVVVCFVCSCSCYLQSLAE